MSAQPKPIPDTPADREVRAWMGGLARAITDASPRDVRSRDDLDRVRPELRRKLLDALGLDPLPERTPLNATVTGTLDRADFRVENLHVQSLPGFYVTANLYLPRGKGRKPAVLYVCGHAKDPIGARVHYRHHATGLVRRGYVVLAVDPMQIAEVPGIHHGSHHLGLWHWPALGYTPMGIEVWNAIRAIDYLVSRPEVDPDRIGMTGRSGGGTMTWHTTAVDDRVKAAVTANATGILAVHAAHDTFRGHCDCTFLVNHARLDAADVAALCAPRPVLVQAGTKDWLFPPEGYRRLVETAGRLYGPPGDAGRLRLQDVEAEHVDLPEFRAEALRWFDRHLRGIDDPSAVPDESDLPPEEALRVLKGTPPPDARNLDVAEWFRPPYASRPPENREAWATRTDELRSRLAVKVFAGEPDPGLIPFELSGDAVESLKGGLRRRTGRIPAEPGLSIRVEVLDREDPGPVDAVLIAACRDGDPSATEPDWTKLAKMLPVVRVFPRGAGGEGWSPELDKFVRRSAVMVGRTLGTMRVTDVRRAAALARADLKAKRVVFYGKSEGAMLALMAGILEPEASVARIIVEDLPDSLLAEPILLNAARVTDVPELLALAAPRGLTVLGRPPLGLERARTIAGLRGLPTGRVGHGVTIEKALDTMREDRR